MQRFALAATTAALFFCLNATAAPTETPSTGFDIAASTALPAPGASYATLGDLSIVTFDGLNVDHYASDGTFLQNLGSVGSFVFPSFLIVDPTETFAILGESSNGDVFRAELNGTGMAPLANLNFNFAAAFEPSGQVLISAALGGFGTGNDLVRMDPVTGATTNLIHVPGPSGPLTFNDAGDLFYALQSDAFPTPPGAIDVLSWTPGQLASGPFPLDETDASIFTGGFDGGSSLAVCPRTQHLFVAESVFGSTSTIYEVDLSGNVVRPVASSDTGVLGNLEFLSLGGLGTFQAFQPAGGERLRCFSTDFGGTELIVDVDPARPQLTLSTLGTSTTLSVAGGQPNGTYALFWTSPADVLPMELENDLGFGFPFVTPFTFDRIGRIGFYFPLDANGEGDFTFFDGGTFTGNYVFQTLITDDTLKPLGTSTTVAN